MSRNSQEIGAVRVVDRVSSIYTGVRRTDPRSLLVEGELNSYAIRTHLYNILLKDEVDMYSIPQKHNILFKNITKEHSI